MSVVMLRGSALVPSVTPTSQATHWSRAAVESNLEAGSKKLKTLGGS
jgi:hypothetical protein